MRSQLWLLAASGHLASANWAFGQGLEYAAVVLPEETRASNHDGANGWTPKPTKGPSAELARRRQELINNRRQADNTWLDESTCGWHAGTECKSRCCLVLTRLLLNKTGHSGTLCVRGRLHLRDEHG